MSLPITVSILSTIGFGVFAVIFALKEEKARQLLAERELKHKQRAYEISMLKEIQDRVGYSLDTGTVVDVITGSLKNLFPYSVASSLLINNNHLIFKSYIEESVDHGFIETVKRNMLDALTTSSHQVLPQGIHESLSGTVLDDTHQRHVASTVTIPFRVNDEVIAVINVSSTKEHLYNEEQMSILYQLTTQASHALSKLEGLLALEKGKLMATISSLADGVFMVTSLNELFIINNAAKKLLNITSAEPTYFEIVNALSAYADFSRQVEAAMDGTATIPAKEIVIGEKTLQIFITPVVSPLHQEPTEATTHGTLGVSVLLHDITLERNLEQMKEDFTHMVVHELRAPLTAVKNASKMLTTDFETMDKPEREQMLSLITEQAQRLLMQVSSILDAAKLDEGRFTINKTPGDFVKLTHEVMLIFKAQAELKHINLLSNISESIPTFPFDSGYMGEVISNLLSNALKFTPENGSITVSAKTEINQLELRVSDTGMGIPKEKQSLLFTKFSQVNTKQNSSAKPETAHKGTGLGLYIVKGIIEAHGGTIKIDSEEGKGTTFIITIPMTQDAPKLLGDVPTARVIQNQVNNH